MRTIWRDAADACLAVLLAPCCAACGGALVHPTGGPVCPDCWAAVRRLTPPWCRSCGTPLPSWRIASLESSRCARCRRRSPALDSTRAVGPYDGALRAIIHAFKYDRRRSLASPLGALLCAAARDLLAATDVAVPVPLHASRLRSRGFNQAADLARRLPLPMAEPIRRVRPTPPQTGLPAAQRHRNVRGAFALARPRWRIGRSCGGAPAVAGRRVLLVDDVATTGATLEACARILKAGGAIEVRAVTLARVATARR